MFQSVVSLYDVFRSDIDYASVNTEPVRFSTDPADYISKDGFYF